jgi:hypothetical protein
MVLLLPVFCGNKIWSIAKPSLERIGFSSFVVAIQAMGVGMIVMGRQM